MQAADDQKTNILEAYYIGQSIRSNVSNVSIFQAVYFKFMKVSAG